MTAPPAQHRTPNATTIRPPSRRNPVVAQIRRDWRRLTGGPRVRDHQRRTLVACSGGADSTALLLALARSPTHQAGTNPVVAHVLHDMRPGEVAERDARAIESLAQALNLEFVRTSVAIAADPGNTEANARRARDAALDRLAHERDCPFVATGHHADDQAETVLMRLIRGSGPAGLAGIHPARPLTHATLVRPMLHVTRVQAQALCAQAGVVWREDETNTDTTRLRAAIRHTVLPGLLDLAPHLHRSLATLGATQGELAALLAEHASEHLQRAHERDGWFHVELPAQGVRHPPIAHELVRQIAARLAGPTGRDALTRKALGPLVRAITHRPGPPARLEIGPFEFEVRGCALRARAPSAG